MKIFQDLDEAEELRRWRGSRSRAEIQGMIAAYEHRTEFDRMLDLSNPFDHQYYDYTMAQRALSLEN